VRKPQPTGAALRLCLWCLLAVAVEIGLYFSYRFHDARFHWFTHFFVGSSAALVVMSVIAWRRHRPVPYPLVWPVAAHLVAMFPNFLFTAGIAHYWWMDVFLGHSTHFVPGHNLTWYLVFLTALGLYLLALSRASGQGEPAGVAAAAFDQMAVYLNGVTAGKPRAGAAALAGRRAHPGSSRALMRR